MSTSTPRPIPLIPIAEHIPDELKARHQWTVWRYEWNARREKWDKVPYIAGTTRKASNSRPSTWRPFADAWACYQDWPDFFDGIEYCFAKDDPYVGGDLDHCIDEAGQLSDDARSRLPGTYVEISPSGKGIKFIARACGDYGRKTKRGELYSRKRFFTITGNIILNHERITDCQADVEAFAASLGRRTTTGGCAGNGSRAELARVSRTRDDALLVVEAKKTERILTEDAVGQARAYAMWLTTPYYLVTNGEDLRVYLFRGAVQSDVLLMNFRRAELAQNWLAFWQTLNKDAVIEYKEKLRKVLDGAIA
jgi:Type I restriction enzyme R protein N terminus (HSDR_N)